MGYEIMIALLIVCMLLCIMLFVTLFTFVECVKKLGNMTVTVNMPQPVAQVIEKPPSADIIELQKEYDKYNKEQNDFIDSAQAIQKMFVDEEQLTPLHAKETT